MRRLLTAAALAALTATLPGALARGEEPASDFDRLLALAGEWQAVAPNGRPARLTFTPVSKGTALYERLDLGGEDMVTVYHRDGDGLRLTHFCASGNQPRMRQVASVASGGELAFAFVDATNLASPLAGHMREIAYVFLDADHFIQRLVWREAGQEVPMELRYERVK
jgi:hypothetical protein